jgi:hypothetical protein
MNASPLIPAPDTIPAPAWLFILLEHTLFLLHILLINVVLGSSLIALRARLLGRVQLQPTLSGLLSPQIPLVLPFAINLGVAPLLFLQVVYGHLFYSSSVLMAESWIAVIPLLIVAYYGVYFYARRKDPTSPWTALALAFAAMAFLYIAFMLVNNVTLMSEPARWAAYFKQRGGTMLNVGDPTLAPRYLHFVVASVAVAGLLGAVLAHRRLVRGEANYEETFRTGLRVFGWATAVQMGVGGWFLMALPIEATRAFMGRNLVATIILMVGMLAALGAIVSALRGKLRPAVVQLLITLLAMVYSRAQLRSIYLDAHFRPESLSVVPQYGMLALFLGVLILGLAVVGYMVRLAFPCVSGGAR